MSATENIGPRTTGKVRPHQTQNEGLLFEKSSPGKRAYKMPPLDVPAVDAATVLGSSYRSHSAELPELSEIEIIRHFTRLSTWNYAIDLGMYPLGSCTMKYNPRVNEFVSRIEGIAEAHPYQPESLSQGALQIIKLLQDCLMEITGMDAITLQPAAGAHGEFTGILLVRAYHESKGNPRKKILIPVSAHSYCRNGSGRQSAFELRPVAIHRPRTLVLRKFRHVRSRLGIHPRQRTRWTAPDDGRRRAERQLHSQESGRYLRASLQDANAARSRIQRSPPDREGDQDRRHREAPHRLRIPSLHGFLPAHRSRRFDDRAHGERVGRGTRSLHRRDEADRSRGGGESGVDPERSALHSHLSS